MVSPRKFLTVLVLLLAILLVLSACEMPIPGSGDPTATLDPNVGGGTDGTPQSEPGDGQTQPTPETGDQAQPTADPGGQAQPTPESGDQAQPTPQPTDQTQPTAVPTPVPTPIPTAVPPTPAGGGGIPPTQEVIHIVQPGENLFRIGLQYGYSWTVLAQYNGIPNPNFVVVGQAIRIPPAGGTGGSGGQPPDGNFTYYVVQPGDNLFRIGLRFGMSWTYIAEANGIVNPHYIVTGQVLKIPVIS